MTVINMTLQTTRIQHCDPLGVASFSAEQGLGLGHRIQTWDLKGQEQYVLEQELGWLYGQELEQELYDLEQELGWFWGQELEQ